MNPVNIRPFRPEDGPKLEAAAAKDGHAVYCPSVVYEKDGEIVGYFSIAVPVVLSWQDSEKVTSLDSMKILGTIEGTLINHPFICIPCDPDSPYMKFLPKNHYQKYFKQLELFIKVKEAK